MMFCLFASERSNDSLSWYTCWCSLCGMYKDPTNKSLFLSNLIFTHSNSPSVINWVCSTDVGDFSTRTKSPPPSVPLSFLYTL